MNKRIPIPPETLARLNEHTVSRLRHFFNAGLYKGEAPLRLFRDFLDACDIEGIRDGSVFAPDSGVLEFAFNAPWGEIVIECGQDGISAWREGDDEGRLFGERDMRPLIRFLKKEQEDPA